MSGWIKTAAVHYDASRSALGNPRERMRDRAAGAVLLCLALFLVPSCINSSQQAGVLNTWRDDSLPKFVVGKTTQEDVVERLGPPSQIIGIGEDVIFYYLRESRTTKGMILLVYNSVDTEILYDRAIFIFDREGVLAQLAESHEAAPYVAPEKDEG